MILATIILFASVFISAISQILLKKAAIKKWPNSIREYLNLYVITAYVIFFLAVFMDLIALRKVSVSLVPVAEASSYIFVILFGKIIFKEKFSHRKIIAMILILSGIIVFVC